MILITGDEDETEVPFEEINSDAEYPTYVIVQKADFDNIISLNLLHSYVGSG